MTNNKDKATYFRLKKTGRSIPRTRKRKGVDENYLEPEVQKVYFDEEFVKNFSLDRFGLPLHSMIKNYTVIENYLLDFWSPIMGGDATYTFILLIRYCYGEDENGNKKDFSYPQLTTIAEKWGKTVETVKKYLDILEENYFIYRFWRSNPERDHANDSILYKLRTSIPYLSEEQIKNLSPKLRKQHDKFIQQIIGKNDEIIELKEKYDYTTEFQEIMKNGRPAPVRKLEPYEIEQINILRKKQLLSQVTDADQQIWEAITSKIRQQLTEPSYTTWFKDTFCIMEKEDSMDVYAPHDFCANWIRTRYVNHIKSSYEESTDIKLSIVQIHSLFEQVPSDLSILDKLE